MRLIEKGRLSARLAHEAGDVQACLDLRAAVFRAGQPDRDAQDAFCQHVMVEEAGQLRATFRLRCFDRSALIGTSYSASRYDLTRLAHRGGAMAELGRFCVAPGAQDPDLIRLAWAAATRLIDEAQAGFLFGCTSFPGTDPLRHRAAFRLLAARSLAPDDWAPGLIAPESVSLRGLGPPDDPAAAARALPPLLRSYLMLGGRVSDHAVIDRDLGTLHVFTGLDLTRVPSARAEALRDLLN